MGFLDFFKHQNNDTDDNTLNSKENSDFEDNDDETLSVYDAALIWASNGKYTFGYTEDELETAL